MTLAPFARRRLPVAGIDELGAYRVLRVHDELAVGSGQFAMLSAAERWGAGQDERPLFGRAFSIARQAGGETHYLLEDVGPGTKRLCELRAGEEIDVVGPLGSGFAAPADGRHAVLIGGGVGIAPLAILQDELGVAGTSVLLGFRDGAHARGAELLSGASVATDDGSVGHHGLVTELLAQAIDAASDSPVVYACGPPPMLEAVRALCEAHGLVCQLALEAAMACGFGACFGCVVPKRGGGYLRVCVDGPVVEGGLLERVEHHVGAAIV